MKQTTSLWSVGAVLAAVVCAVSTTGQDRTPPKQDAPAARGCAMCDGDAMPCGNQASQRQEGPQGTAARCPMMTPRADAGDPAGLLALRDSLELTEEQIGKLQAILKKAYEDAKALLTDKQREKLEELTPERPRHGPAPVGRCPMRDLRTPAEQP